MTRVCIIDYGSGNSGSVYHLFEPLAGSVVLSGHCEEIRKATHLVLPGVGAFGPAVTKLRARVALDVLERQVLMNHVPFLGLCVGMQVLADRGCEFGDHKGLGWLPGVVAPLNSQDVRIPHMGWNSVNATSADTLLAGLENGTDFYFAHSFSFRPTHAEMVRATTVYGDAFCSVVRCANICGVQFHPEKSQNAGLRLAHNFLAMQ